MNPLLPAPATVPILDPGFRPAVLANRAFGEAVKASGQPVAVRLALQRSDASVSSYSFAVLPEQHPHAASNFFFTERLCKFLLWSRGAATIFFDGPSELCARL